MKGVFFDLDGTLFDTIFDIAASVNYALKEMNYKEVSIDRIRSFLGHGLRNVLKECLKDNGVENADEELFKKLYTLLINYYTKHPAVYTTPYDGIEQMLNFLKKERGIKTALISNKADIIVQGIVRKYPLSLDFVIGARDDIPMKPDPAMINLALEKLSLDATDVVYVGDSEVDQQTAKNAKMDRIIVSYGFRSEEELIKSNILDSVESVEKLSALLTFKCNSLISK